MKNPVQLYIYWHPNFVEGKELSEYLFVKLNRDPNNINFRDIGIPISFKNLLNDENDIDYEIADKIFIILLIDDNVVVDSNWNNKISEILKDTKGKGNVILLPVAFNVNSLNVNFEGKNLIRVFDIELWESMFKETENLGNSIEFKKEFLLNEVSHEIARELIDPDGKKPLKLFLSHAKADGLKVTRILKQYIETFTKSKTFFDANDIEIGREFWSIIEGNIKESFVVIVHSDKYTNSKWCRKEILSAKSHGRPILCINALENEEDRSYPYMANVKTIRLTENSRFKEFYHVVTEIYREAIRVSYNKLKINLFVKNVGLDADIFTSAPELLNFTRIKNIEKKTIIYPDPPLSDEETELFNSEKKYITPLTYVAQNSKVLFEKKIAFSISESSEDQKKLKFCMLKDIMNELIRYVFYYSGNIYYGGDLKYDVKENYNLLRSMINTLDVYKKVTEENAVKIKNYVAFPLTENLSLNEEAKYKNIVEFEKIIPQGYKTNLSKEEKENLFTLKTMEDLKKWSISLTSMREKLLNEIDAIIILGGKTTGYKGKYPGILEEFLLAKNKNKPIYLLGGFGGVSGEIIKLIKGNDSKMLFEKYQIENNGKNYESYYNSEISIKYEDICNQIKTAGFSQLNNGLSLKENEILFKSEDAHEIMSLIIKGFSRI